MSEKNLLTGEGKASLEKELKELIEVKRGEIVKEIQIAREQGDLSENADYSSAKDEQGRIESRISEIQSILNNYEIISTAKSNTVRVGSQVKLHNLKSGKIYEFEIVGEHEANPDENKISNVCPVAVAIIGKAAGETVQIKNVSEPYKIKIVSLK
jgi:transcription elongation factor GreA